MVRRELKQAATTLTQGGHGPSRSERRPALRRCESGRRDKLRVCSRPPGSEPFGIYETRRPREPIRPYSTLLESLQPLRGSCDCPDFLRSSLGVCKHMFAVLDEITSRPRKLRRALSKTDGIRPVACLRWEAARPLAGKGDWLEQVRLLVGSGRSVPRRAALAKVRRRFDSGSGDARILKDTFVDHPRHRLQLVGELLSALPRRRRNGKTAEPALRALLSGEKCRLERVVADK